MNKEPRSSLSEKYLLATQLTLTEIGRKTIGIAWQPFSESYLLLYCFSLGIGLVLFGEISDELVAGAE